MLGQDYNNDNVPVVGYNGNGICDEVDYIGCTDETACNYNPLIEDGGSATIIDNTQCISAWDLFGIGCQEIEGCLDDDGAIYEYQTSYVDCQGECINDFNNYSICDEQ